jgi:zinc protease
VSRAAPPPAAGDPLDSSRPPGNLDGGLRGRLHVRVRRVEGAPVVGVRAWVLGGARVEAVPGQSLVTGRLLTEGTRRRSWREIADDVERLGMDLGSGSGFEQHDLGLDALADDWERALEWAAELVLEPVFPEDRCAFACRQVAAELESLADRPEVRTAWAFLEQLYTPHPRSRPVQGDPESLASLTPGRCAEHHTRGLGSGLIVAVAGRIDEAAVEARVRELFTGSDGPAETLPEPPAPRGLPETHREIPLPLGEAETDQAHLLMGHLTLPRNHPDYEALELAGVVLGAGSGLAGRIPERIREREGLAYSVRAQTVAGCGLDPGRLLIYVGTSVTRVEQAERGVREEVARLVADGITEQEMEDARSFLLGREPFARETARQWADLLAEAVLLGIPLDEPGWREERLRSLTREQVEEALRRHLQPGALEVTVGVPNRG